MVGKTVEERAALWVVQQLCGEPPPQEFWDGWFLDDNDVRLRDWMNRKTPPQVDADYLVDAIADMSGR